MSDETLKSYRDPRVWQIGMDLAEECYRTTGDFPRPEVFGLTSQIRRVAASIPANIAEGYGRRTTRDYLHFLYIAQGSLKELETHILLASRLAFLAQHESETLLTMTDHIGRMIGNLCRALDARIRRPTLVSQGVPTTPNTQPPTP